MTLRDRQHRALQEVEQFVITEGGDGQLRWQFALTAQRDIRASR